MDSPFYLKAREIREDETAAAGAGYGFALMGAVTLNPVLFFGGLSLAAFSHLIASERESR